MKKNIILLSTIILVSTMAFGQEAKSKHIGLSLLTKVNKPIYENSNLGSGKNTLGLNIQFEFLFDINSRVQLYSGLNLSFLKTSTLDYSAILPCDVGFNGADSFNSWYEDKYKMKYLGIPLGIKLKLIGSDNHIYTRVGTEFLFKLNHESESLLIECGISELELENNIVNTPSDLVIAANIGIGYEMKICEKYKMYIEPTIGYTITSIYEEAGILGDLTNNVYILDYGLRVGIRI